LEVWENNLCVYGADKVWDQLNKDGICVQRCTVERLMADMGLQGCRRGRLWIRTTVGDDTLDRPADLVKRQFQPGIPDKIWVTDLERHEAPLNRVVMKGHHGGPVAAGTRKLRAA
jgi:putative transposase